MDPRIGAQRFALASSYMLARRVITCMFCLRGMFCCSAFRIGQQLHVGQACYQLYALFASNVLLDRPVCTHSSVAILWTLVSALSVVRLETALAGIYMLARRVLFARNVVLYRPTCFLSAANFRLHALTFGFEIKMWQQCYILLPELGLATSHTQPKEREVKASVWFPSYL
jgi:hypothetical protein